MDCMQFINMLLTAHAFVFQYRKRYGLHAIVASPFRERTHHARFNTASGMDCMQFEIPFLLIQYARVSIPQAVWIACNEKGEFPCGDKKVFQYRKRYGLHAIRQWRDYSHPPLWFQYRKRYGLHAILSPGSLGNSEPKNRVSNDDPLFAFFPKVSGTFLSRKVLRKGLEASHSKGTFVHERNLILMAFSLDFRASLEQSIS